MFHKTLDLPSGDAWWVPEHQAIIVREDLGLIDRRCAVDHELAHQEFGHRHHVGPDATALNREQERQASFWSAGRLVEFSDLLVALVNTNTIAEAALWLFVTEDVLRHRVKAISHPSELGRVRAILREKGYVK